MEQKEANKRSYLLKLAEDHKRAQEKLQDQINKQREKAFDKKQLLELEIRQMKGFLEVLKRIADEDVKALKSTNELVDLEEELKDLEVLNQHLIVKDINSTNELVDARKELISALKENSTRSIIGVKRMGVLDVKPFIAARSNKIEAVKLASLRESHLSDPN